MQCRCPGMPTCPSAAKILPTAPQPAPCLHQSLPCLHQSLPSQFPRQRQSPGNGCTREATGIPQHFHGCPWFPIVRKRIANVQMWKLLKRIKCLPMALFSLICDGWRHGFLRHIYQKLHDFLSLSVFWMSRLCSLAYCLLSHLMRTIWVHLWNLMLNRLQCELR